MGGNSEEYLTVVSTNKGYAMCIKNLILIQEFLLTMLLQASTKDKFEALNKKVTI